MSHHIMSSDAGEDSMDSCDDHSTTATTTNTNTYDEEAEENDSMMTTAGIVNNSATNEAAGGQNTNDTAAATASDGHTDSHADSIRQQDNTSAGSNAASSAVEAVAATAAATQETPAPGPAPTQPTARLLISRIVMENFKSYGGVREIGPFHKRFSSIVGPNGSGKSNVIDAMLFVFGKRAKKLRLKKVSELIHRSDTFPHLDFARVAVHFVDILDSEGSADEYEEVPGTELVVTRTAFSNNQSKYHVDGKNATWTEVQALLLKRGVDLEHNRFLILQGEVEQIAMMKAKAMTPHEDGLLEYLEEIIGSNRFVEDTKLASERVEELNNQRAEKLNRLKMAEKDKDGLENDKVEAETYLKLDAKCRAKSNVLYQVQRFRAVQNAEKIAEKESQLKERKEYEKQKLAATVTQVKETKRTHDVIHADNVKLTTQMKKVKEEYDEYERRDIEYQSNKKFQKDQIRKLETAIKKEDKRSKDSLARAAELEGGLGPMKRSVEQAEARKASEETALEEVNESLKGKTSELREELESEQEKAQPVRKEADALRNKVETCKCEMKLLRESTEDAKKRLSGEESALETLLSKAATDKTDLSSAKNEMSVMEQKINEAERRVEEAKGQLAAKTESMIEAISAAEEAKGARELAANKTGPLRAVLEAAVPGGALEHAGVYGRLGDLGVIDGKYDVAVSSASGTFDHVVVETADGGQKCIEYLKATNAGRLNFAVLDRLDHLKPSYSRPFPTPTGCPRLFDLISPSDEKFRPAFYLAVRDALVARDLDTAIANAYEGKRCKHRIVSLDGQLIDTSGAMTGGGKSVRRGAMRTRGASRSGAGAAAAAPSATGIVSEAQAQHLDSLARSAQSDVDKATADLREEQGMVKKVQARAKYLQTQIPKLETQLQGVAASEAQYREQIATLKGQCQLSPEAQGQLDELGKSLARDEKALAKVSQLLETAESAIQELQTAILEVGGERLKKAVKRVDAASKALDEAVNAVNRATVEGQGERKKGEKLAKDAEKKRKELEGIRENAKKAEEEFGELEERAYEVLKRFEAAEEVVKEKAVELKEIAEEYEKARALEDKIRSVEMDIANQLEEYAKTIKENKTHIKKWDFRVRELRDKHRSEAEEWGLDDVDNDDEDEDDMDEEEQEMEDDGGMEESNGGEANQGDLRENGSEKDSKSKEKRKKKDGSRGLGYLPELSLEHLEDIDSERLKLEIGELEAQRKKAEGNVNLSTLAQYRLKERDYVTKATELEEATVARNDARGRHEELRRQRLAEFMDGFGQITLRLKEMYQMITLGGDAELELVDSLDPFSEGIVFSVRPPKKSWKNIANLSGGEKTLSSLALVFALHHFKPTPLYVMDEIDAALDFKNVSIVANYIKERTKNAQFIIISLRNNMFEIADRLVGIYKTHNVTKSVTINPKEFATAQMSSKVKPTPKAAGILGNATNSLRISEA